MTRRGAWLPLVAALAGLVACAHPVQRRDWSAYQGAGAAYFHQEEIEPPDFPDPLEPWNRGVGVVNHGFVVGLVTPLARAYHLITPKVVRQRIQKFAANLTYPRRLLANALQGSFREAGDETLRFGINSTVGVLGFFDPASHWGIEAAEEDFGQTFAKWGWRPSTYLVLPIFGPSTVRDSVGLIPDNLTNPATYFFPAGPILTFNELSEYVDFYKRFTSSNYDPYQLARLAWLLSREEEVADYEYEVENTAAVQTLQSLFLTYRDPKWPRRMKTGKLRMPVTQKVLPYSFKMQKDPAPLLFIIPGLGAHRLGDSPLALAEMAWEHGFSVAMISSSMNFEFMQAGASVPVPGYAPVDARDAHRVLDAIYRELDEQHPERITSKALMGYSLGAFHTFYIAAAERDPENELIEFDRYVTLDAPVRLMHGVEQLDRYYNAPLAFPPDERMRRIRAILQKAVDVGRSDFASEEDFARIDSADLGQADLTPEQELPFSNIEAEFLIGLSFRVTLESIIYASQEREDLGVLRTERGWFRRGSAYQEISDYSFSEYIYAFVLPYYRDHLGRVSSADQLVAMNDLRSIADGLRGQEKIRHFANHNDFLTTDEDVAWLANLLGEEYVRFFPTGGHLGGLYRPEVQDEVMRALVDLVP